MNVHIRYFAAAADYAGADSEVIEVGEGATVSDLAESIKASRLKATRSEDSDRLVKVLDLASFLVNGKRAELADVLPADAEVDVLPPFAGG